MLKKKTAQGVQQAAPPTTQQDTRDLLAGVKSLLETLSGSWGAEDLSDAALNLRSVVERFEPPADVFTVADEADDEHLDTGDELVDTGPGRASGRGFARERARSAGVVARRRTRSSTRTPPPSLGR